MSFRTAEEHVTERWADTNPITRVDPNLTADAPSAERVRDLLGNPHEKVQVQVLSELQLFSQIRGG